MLRSFSWPLAVSLGARTCSFRGGASTRQTARLGSSAMSIPPLRGMVAASSQTAGRIAGRKAESEEWTAEPPGRNPMPDRVQPGERAGRGAKVARDRGARLRTARVGREPVPWGAPQEPAAHPSLRAPRAPTVRRRPRSHFAIRLPTCAWRAPTPSARSSRPESRSAGSGPRRIAAWNVPWMRSAPESPPFQSARRERAWRAIRAPTASRPWPPSATPRRTSARPARWGSAVRRARPRPPA